MSFETTTPPKILFVDDEEPILGAARRLLRSHKVEVLTARNGEEALQLIAKNEIWAVISDYRMPGMTGAELLERLRREKPEITRVMLTGYIEIGIMQEAVNRAGVFRFITKPWQESELLLGIEAALQHHHRQLVNHKLLHAVGVQNHQLERLTHSLEAEVISRTSGIEESKRLAEEKQRQVRELTAFVKGLSRVKQLHELFDLLDYEMKRFAGVTGAALLVLEGMHSGQVFWREGRFTDQVKAEKIPESFYRLAVRTAVPEEQLWWAHLTQHQNRDLILIPIRARDHHRSRSVALFIVEHTLPEESLSILLDRLTDRLQPVAIVFDRLILEEQLLQATRQWEATFDGFNDPIAVVDNHERVVRGNRKFLKVGETFCYQMFDGRDTLCEGCPMPRAVLSMEAASQLVRTSSQKTYRVNSYPILLPQTEQDYVSHVVNHYMDVSGERDLYMRLVQSEKLAAVGGLAGNIAHELNNPLSGIRAMAQVLKGELGATDPHAVDLGEIENAAVRCQDIIRNLLGFSQAEGQARQEFDLNALIERTLPLLKTALRQHSVQVLLTPNLSHAFGQPGQVQQVIFNLINNASQAMTLPGTLTLRTWQEGSMIGFSVSDTGPGIPAEIRERIFEPFFTTKSAGVGTGLGLSVSRNIVEKAGGVMRLESHPEAGSTFSVLLPKQGRDS